MARYQVQLNLHTRSLSWVIQMGPKHKDVDKTSRRSFEREREKVTWSCYDHNDVATSQGIPGATGVESGKGYIFSMEPYGVKAAQLTPWFQISGIQGVRKTFWCLKTLRVLWLAAVAACKLIQYLTFDLSHFLLAFTQEMWGQSLPPFLLFIQLCRHEGHRMWISDVGSRSLRPLVHFTDGINKA